MRLVLDTNVLVAAFIAHGACHEVLEHCALHHDIVLSESLLDEFQSVLTREFGFARSEAAEAAALLRSRAVVIQPARLPERVCRDADDDKVLAAALAGDCTCIVTGDHDLLDLGEYRSIAIVSPNAYFRFEKDGILDL